MIDIKTFKSFSKEVANIKVMVIGDIMLDVYKWGKVERISPEAPVPILNLHREEFRLGGAGNVAVNLKQLGAQVLLCGVCGKDSEKEILISQLHDNGLSTNGILELDNRKTSTKTRMISGNQQLLRYDWEDTGNLKASAAKKWLTHLLKCLKTENIDVVIFEDYDKGALSKTIIKPIIAYCQDNHILTAVDPKKNNFLDYTHVNLFKPNLRELEVGLKKEIKTINAEEINHAVNLLDQKIKAQNYLITLSENGVFFKDQNSFGILPAHIRKISDVSGAGDTVISVASLCLALGFSLEKMAWFSNLAGGLVCEKVGVVPITGEELSDEIKQLTGE